LANGGDLRSPRIAIKTTVQGEWNFSGQPVPDASGHALNKEKSILLNSNYKYRIK